MLSICGSLLHLLSTGPLEHKNRASRPALFPSRKALLAQSPVFQHRLDLRIVSAPLAIEFS